MPGIGGRYLGLGTGTWIREYLRQQEDYPYHMWKEFLKTKPGGGKYDNFRRYIWLLKKLGFIRVTRTEKGKRGGMRNYYTIVRKKIDDPRWDYPQIALYPKTGLGGYKGKRYKEWVVNGKPIRKLKEIERGYKLR